MGKDQSILCTMLALVMEQGQITDQDGWLGVAGML